MSWEAEKMHRTLFIEVLPGNDGRKRYAIQPICRVTDDYGTTYLEPLPFDAFATGTRDIWRFDEVHFIDPVTADRMGTRGDLGLTNFGDSAVRRGA